MRFVTVAALAVLAGCGSPPVNGTLSDSMSGNPIGALRVTARAEGDSASMTCMSFETESDEAGKFTLEGLCSGETYALELGNEDLWLPEPVKISDPGAVGQLDLKVWRVPKGPGIYKRTGDEVISLKTHADLKTERITKSEETVLYPGNLPKKAHVLGADDTLLLVGVMNMEKTQFAPLIPSGTRVFQNDDVKVTMQPWAYIGTEFSSDTEFTRVEAEVDAASFKDMKGEDRVVRMIPAKAFKPGRYALYQGDGTERTRVTVVDFGGEQEFKLPEK